MSDILDILFTSDVTIGKRNGLLSRSMKAIVENNQIQVHDIVFPIDEGDFVICSLPNGKHEGYEIQTIDYREGKAGIIPQRRVLHCVRRRKHNMPVFGSHHSVTVVRERGTPNEKTWETKMSGDLNTKALFYLDDRVKTGDELESHVFDEPRIISKVNGVQMVSGISHWEAEILTQSEWKRLHPSPSHHITVTGTGARVNLHSVDQSAQYFHNEQDNAMLLRGLDELKAAIQNGGAPASQRKEAALDVDQLKIEVQRAKPDKSRVSALLENLNSVVGIAEKLTKLIPFIEHLF